MTPMGPLHEKSHQRRDDGKAPAVKVVTPGVERAAKMAEKDLKALESADKRARELLPMHVRISGSIERRCETLK